MLYKSAKIARRLAVLGESLIRSVLVHIGACTCSGPNVYGEVQPCIWHGPYGGYGWPMQSSVVLHVRCPASSIG